MTSDRFARIETLYHAARARPAEARATYLAEACRGDEDLRREVESLLEQPGVGVLTSDSARPALASGTVIGVYRIVEQIGAGGMGEVYRAYDTKLGRDVAVKVLPSGLAGDRDLLARLEREARLLASLNHPNIAQIYGLEESNGNRAIVMELVKGDTLADRIARSPIPLKEALPITRQICEALDAAHERGIIHRDLKPANIKVRSDGTVKVLDFGLAKTIDPSDPAVIQNSPTMTATARGVILGTATYMSPEQAAGGVIDKRSDIWAVGVVLTEMLTGTRAFAGDTVSQVLASVIKDQPDLSGLPSDTPASIRKLLRRCLEKDRKRRIADAADVRLEIEDALTSSADPWMPTPSRRLTLGWTYGGAAILLVVLVTVLATIRGRGVSDAPPPVMRVDISMPTIPTAFALSPDGRYLAFVGSSDGPQGLWLRPMDKTEAHPLAGTEEANHPFWSPDSRSIGFFAAGKLRRVDVDGGPPRDIAEAAPYGASWNADDTILFIPTAHSPLSSMPASGGQPVAVARLDPQTTHRWPHSLPDGRHYLYFIGGAADTKGLYLGSLDGDEPKRLTTNQWAGEYLPPGFVLTVRQGALVAQKLDLTRRELTGDLITLAYPIDYVSGFFEGFSVAANGLVAYRTSGGRRQLTWFDRSGRAVGVAAEPDATFIDYPELSPDDRMIAVQRGVPNADIWWMNTVGGGWNRLTFDAANHAYPLWSRDGSRLLFTSNRQDVYWKPSNGAGPDEALLETPNAKVAQDRSKDGRYLLYSEDDPKTGSDLWVLDITGPERKRRAFVNGSADELMGTFSPDGRWVAYETNESGRSEIIVTSFPNPTGRWRVGGGRQPRWRADGSELYFIAPDGKLMAEPVSPLGTAFEVRPATPLFQVPIQTSSAAPHKPQYAVARDGRFLINQPAKEATVAPITLLMNWTSTLPK